MQFFILLLGVMVFVFYQFEQPPVFFNHAAWQQAVQHDRRRKTSGASNRNSTRLTRRRNNSIRQWLDAKHAGDRDSRGRRADAGVGGAGACRRRARRGQDASCKQNDPGAKSNDADYVFITFILDHLPHGVDRAADCGVLCRRASIEGRRTERARLDHHD